MILEVSVYCLARVKINCREEAAENIQIITVSIESDRINIRRSNIVLAVVGFGLNPFFTIFVTIIKSKRFCFPCRGIVFSD